MLLRPPKKLSCQLVWEEFWTQTSVKEYAGTNLKQARAATRTYVWKIPHRRSQTQLLCVHNFLVFLWSHKRQILAISRIYACVKKSIFFLCVHKFLILFLWLHKTAILCYLAHCFHITKLSPIFSHNFCHNNAPNWSRWAVDKISNHENSGTVLCFLFFSTCFFLGCH